MKITIEATAMAPIADVWRAWTTPEDIKQWNAASNDWHTTAATVDLRVGGRFSSRMEAKDGSMGFDFWGTYTAVVPNRLLELGLGDGRTVQIEFSESPAGVTIRETFDAEPTHSPEQQREGWQAILNRFVQHVEANRKGDA
ncbi:MAG: SRPBCC family protein [Rhodocyclaceae bacterium]|nr:SRPBCC family protein [Rhodocyclaceae bacterium]MCP5239313.1 SRPBCC domain-containing protein [Zoogloeaceae bacterium]MCP5295624.1 SRPBCC domain-containing protein [Zoogloeaceae bacterium]MCP5415279.1 SRPBCC domain-containing protein [Chromatiaceae bacterium]MCW5616294.1 SRPBCC family protein [Rhodocyclaceae bacterium]